MRGLAEWVLIRSCLFFPIFLLFSVESSLDGSKFPYRVWGYSANVQDFCLVFFGMEAGFNATLVRKRERLSRRSPI